MKKYYDFNVDIKRINLKRRSKMFSGHDECEQKFEDAPKIKTSENIRAIAGIGKKQDELILVRRVILIRWAEELESLGN